MRGTKCSAALGSVGVAVCHRASEKRSAHMRLVLPCLERHSSFPPLSPGYKRVPNAEAEPLWRFWYDWCNNHCYHGERARAGAGLLPLDPMRRVAAATHTLRPPWRHC